MFVSRAKSRKSKLDMTIVAVVLILLAIGTISIISSVPGQERVLRTHFMALPISILAFAIFFGFNYQVFQDQWKFIYALMIIALAAVLFFGVADKGSRSWFRIPFFSIQPSEFVRIGLILVTANYLDKVKGKIQEFKYFIGAWILALPLFFMLMKQPDFSSVLTMIPIIFTMLFLAGSRLFHILTFFTFTAVCGGLPLLWTIVDLKPGLRNLEFVKFFYSLSRFGWETVVFWILIAAAAWIIWRLLSGLYINLSVACVVALLLAVVAGHFSAIFVKKQIKFYQQKRIEAFLSPETDPMGSGYNIFQAQIALGSGGILGKGPFSGSQSKLGFVPERHTDFILAVIGENMGFAGMLLTMFLYIVLMNKCFYVAGQARDGFGYFTCGGIFAMFFVYFTINFGMVLGVVPVAGVPLPLVSYGGSNLVATMIALGILQSVYARRYAFQ